MKAEDKHHRAPEFGKAWEEFKRFNAARLLELEAREVFAKSDESKGGSE